MNDWLRRLLDLPPQASTYARGVDGLHYAVIGTTMAGAFAVFAVAIALLVLNRERAAPRTTAHVEASRATELLVVSGVLTLFLGFWIIGATQYDRMMTPPPGALPVYVTAKQWMWKFTYGNGRSTIDVLFVPVGRPIKLVMTSRDVIHSFYVPAFRMKHDVVPGRYYAAWFEATTPGTYDVDCAEYCGVSHSRMLGKVRVLSADDYARWQAAMSPGESRDLVAEGLGVAARHGCFACHTIDGQPHIGPTWARLYGSTVALEGGRTAVADDGYLTRSMMEPNAEVVAGFKAVMPTYRGVLDEPETAALLEFLESLRDGPVAPGVPLPKVETATPPKEPER